MIRHSWWGPASQTWCGLPGQRDPDAVDLLVQGDEVHDVALLRELNLPVAEAVVRVPADLLPELRKELQPC